MKNRFLSGILVLLCLFALAGCENSKSITGTVVSPAPAAAIYIKDKPGIPDGIYQIGAPSEDITEKIIYDLKEGDLVEVRYTDIAGMKYKKSPTAPAFLIGSSDNSDIKILGEATGEEQSEAMKYFETCKAEWDEVNETINAYEFTERDESTAQISGTAVSLDPLTVYVSEPLYEKRMAPGFYTVETFGLGDGIELKEGMELSVTFQGRVLTEPGHLYNVSDIREIGEADRAKYEELHSLFEDYKAQRRFLNKTGTLPLSYHDHLLRSLHMCTGTVVDLKNDEIIVYTDEYKNITDTLFFALKNDTDPSLKPEIGQKITFYHSGWYGYAISGPHSLNDTMHFELVGKTGGGELQKTLDLYDEYNKKWELEMKKITG